MAHLVVGITGKILLFSLIFGMAATVDVNAIKSQIKNTTAIMTGLCLQFILMPFLGWLVVKSFELDYVTGLTLLVVTSSPGGSYSNWWCSIFNADLALSVTMTAVSTILSALLLPLNLFIYANMIYEDEIIDIIEWDALLVSLGVVISAVMAGLACSAAFETVEFNLNANRLGNFAGIALVLFSLIMSNSDTDYQVWDYDWEFYFAVGLPCVLGLVIANVVTTSLWLVQPERVTVSIECCYQNIGIATALCVSMFHDDAQLSEALGVPFFYGICEAVLLAVYCVWAWQMGWTKAPNNITIFKAMATSFEVKTRHEHWEQEGKAGAAALKGKSIEISEDDNNGGDRKQRSSKKKKSRSDKKSRSRSKKEQSSSTIDENEEDAAWNYVDYGDLDDYAKSMEMDAVENDPQRIQRAKKELLKSQKDPSGYFAA